MQHRCVHSVHRALCPCPCHANAHAAHFVSRSQQQLHVAQRARSGCDCRSADALRKQVRPAIRCALTCSDQVPAGCNHLPPLVDQSQNKTLPPSCVDRKPPALQPQPAGQLRQASCASSFNLRVLDRCWPWHPGCAVVMLDIVGCV
jgi:hypothetical protein